MSDEVALQAFAAVEHRREREHHRGTGLLAEEVGELLEGAFRQGVWGWLAR